MHFFGDLPKNLCGTLNFNMDVNGKIVKRAIS